MSLEDSDLRMNTGVWKEENLSLVKEIQMLALGGRRIKEESKKTRWKPMFFMGCRNPESEVHVMSSHCHWSLGATHRCGLRKPVHTSLSNPCMETTWTKCWWILFPARVLMATRFDGIWAQLELLIASPRVGVGGGGGRGGVGVGRVPLYRSLLSHLFSYSCVELTTFGVLSKWASHCA